MITITATKYKIKIDNYNNELNDIWREHHIKLIRIENM